MTDTHTSTIPAATNGGTPLSSSAGGQLIDRSFVHTTEAFINARDMIDLITSRNSKDTPAMISVWSVINNGQQAKFQFNPNCNRNRLSYCDSLAEFKDTLDEWAISEGFEPDDVRFKRADFALDCMTEQNEDMFVKLASLVVFAFYAKHKPRTTDKKRFEVADELDFTGYLARKAGFPVQLDLYDKSKQNLPSGVLWRFEVRYVETARNRHKRDDIKAMLEAVIDELNDLKNYFDQAQMRLSYYLAKRFKALQQGSKKPMSRNQFLYQYGDRVFSSAQIQEFYKLVLDEPEEMNIAKCAYNFADRYDHLFVSKSEFHSFIDEAVSCIKSYLESLNYEVKLSDSAVSYDMSWMAELLGGSES